MTKPSISPFGLLTKILLTLLLTAPSVLGQNETIEAQPKVASTNSGLVSDSTTESAPLSGVGLSATQRLEVLEGLVVRQAKELEQLREALAEQNKTLNSLLGELGKVKQRDPFTAVGPSETGSKDEVGSNLAAANTAEDTRKSSLGQNKNQDVETRLKQVEERILKIGPFRLSGDFRLRADGAFRSASNPPDPPTQHLQNARVTYRLRLNFDTEISPTLSFHGQLATGAANNQLSNNYEFGSIGLRNPFFLSEVWVDYHPNKSLTLQGGRVQSAFADNSRFIFDDDLRFNGFNEKYVWSFKKAPAKISSVEVRAGQYILTNPNVAVITPGSPLASAGAIVGTSGRSANLFHQGFLINRQLDKDWSDQFGSDLQWYRHPNQIQLASTNSGLALLLQPGLGLTLSGPLGGIGNGTTTQGGAIYSAGGFQIARITYRLNHTGFRSGDHSYPIMINVQAARNVATGLNERDAMLAALQVGKVTKRGDTSFLYFFTIKGANAIISQLTDDDVGTGSGVNIRAHHLRFEYGLSRKVAFQSLFYFQKQLRSSGQYPNFFVPLGAFVPRTFRFQQQLVFTF